jgi:hypothetical protein
MSSCHFYEGATIAAPTAQLRGIVTETFVDPDDLPAPLRLLDRGMRVYASLAAADRFHFGDAYGYVRTAGIDGASLGQHHCGSSISGRAPSPDGRVLAVGSSSGCLHRIDLDRGTADPFPIGTTRHVERRRHMSWRDQPAPLRW